MIRVLHPQFSINRNSCNYIFKHTMQFTCFYRHFCLYSILNVSSSSLPMMEHKPWGIWGNPSIIDWCQGQVGSLNQPTHCVHRCIHHLRKIVFFSNATTEDVSQIYACMCACVCLFLPIPPSFPLFLPSLSSSSFFSFLSFSLCHIVYVMCFIMAKST